MLKWILFCRFTLVKEHLVEFNQLAMANADGLDHMLNRVMPRDNIGLAALLQTKEAAWDNGMYITFKYFLHLYIKWYTGCPVDDGSTRKFKIYTKNGND